MPAALSPDRSRPAPPIGRPTWSADYAVSPALAREVIQAQFPQLAGARVGLLGEGWDNAVYRVDVDVDVDGGGPPAGPRDDRPAEAPAVPSWAFRFPRRRIALRTLAREAAVLPALADLLPLPIPRPLLVGAPSPAHPRSFWGGPLLPGVELLHAEAPDPARVAAALGRFLRVLHSPGLVAQLHRAAPGALAVIPLDPNGRADAASVADRGRERMAAIEAGPGLRAGVAQLLDRAAALPRPRLRPVLSHGDLHLRHVLLEDGAISGVIDWGDLCFTDRSVDLGIAYAAFGGPSRAALLDAYGPVDAATGLRARAVAAFLCAALAHHAQDVGDRGSADAALAGLARAIAP